MMRETTKHRGPLIFLCTFVLAFCSIVYELLLGQTLSAFLGNTVLRYSVTIGLYMLSMGFGALLARKRVLEHPVVSLQAVEVLLTLLGGTSVLVLFVVDALGAPSLLFSLLAHAFILVIGVLTGLEIPLLIELRSAADEHAASGVLGIDYAGAFLGTVFFAFYFYPRLGIVSTAFVTASLNAVVGALLFAFRDRVRADRRGTYRRLLTVQIALAGVLAVGLVFSSYFTELSVALYLGE